MNFTVQQADYHRNGISGDGFYVGLVTDHDNNDRTMLVVSFPDIGQCAVAVLDVSEAARGNIYMNPSERVPRSGGNAWRGDHYTDAAKAIQTKVEERWG